MIPTDFHGSNTPMLKPDNMTAEECGDLQVRLLKTYRGPQYTSCWKPSYEDMKLLEQGKAVVIEMHIDASIFVNVDTKLTTFPALHASQRAVVWVPGSHELEDLQNGCGIFITFLCSAFPVMAVYVNE